VKKTLEETSRAVDRAFVMSKVEKQPNTSVHEHVRCDGCQVFPIVGVRYKCNECPDFDFCEVCEEKFGDQHGHPLTKHRTPAVRPAHCRWGRKFFGGGRCPRRQNEGQETNKEEGQSQGKCGFRRHPFFQFIKEKLQDVKGIFNTEELNQCNLEGLNLETNTSEKQEQPKVEEPTNEEKIRYVNQLNELRIAFDLGGKTDEEILTALTATKGNVDEALILLFQ